MTVYPQFAIGAMVTVEAPSSRGDDGAVRIIPAVVMHQWPDGSLQLFAFHFEGSFLMNSVPYETVKPVEPAAKPEPTFKKYSIRDAN